MLFALLANRALEPLSKLAATAWMSERAWIDGLPDDVTDDACYRAMDWLLEIEEQLCERVSCLDLAVVAALRRGRGAETSA